MKALLTLLPLFFGDTLSYKEVQQPFSLKLNQETYLTDTTGVVNFVAVLNVLPGDLIKIYLPSGVYYNGVVKELTTDTSGIFKVVGEITNSVNMSFGIVLAKEGVVAGAIGQTNSDVAYCLAYSKAAKGHTFQYVSKISK